MNQQSQSITPYQIVEKGEIQLMGISVRTTNELEMTNNAKIPALWGQFWGEQIQADIPSLSEPVAIYGCYHDYESDASGEYALLVGCQVSNMNVVPEGMQVAILPKATYAVFTTAKGPIIQEVVRTWQTIWSMAAESKLERTYTGDFELYDERSMDPDDGQVDIYIAIR